MRKIFCVVIAIAVVWLTGCTSALVSPNTSNQGKLDPPQPTPPTPKFVLAPTSVVKPHEQDQVFKQVMKRLQPTANQHITIAELNDEEAMTMLGRTVNTVVVNGYNLDITFSGEKAVEVISREPLIHPVLSPDNKTIAFHDYSREDTLILYDVASGKSVKIPKTEDNILPPKPSYWGATPIWSRDGEYLYFCGYPDGKQRLFRVRRDGQNLEQLCPDRDIRSLYGWTQDETLIVASSGISAISVEGSIKWLGQRTATIGAVSPSGKLLIAGPWHGPTITIHNLRTSSVKDIQLPGTFEYNSDPMGWSPSEQRLATIVISREGVVALAVIDMNSGKSQLAPLPIGYSPTYKPISWLDEGSFIVWQTDGQSMPQDERKVIPFFVHVD